MAGRADEGHAGVGARLDRSEVGVGLFWVLVLMLAGPGTIAGALWLLEAAPGLELPRRRRRAPGPPVEQLVADLQRLSGHLDRVRRSNEPAKVARLTAVSMAYDKTLLIAAVALQLPVCQHLPLSATERIETEVELSRAGLRW